MNLGFFMFSKYSIIIIISFHLAESHLVDEQRSGRPTRTKMDENIAPVTDFLNEHRSVSCKLKEE